MIVEIDLQDGQSALARLSEPEDFKGFKVVLRGGAPSISDRLGAVGVVRFEEHAWIRVDAVRELAGAAATPEWEESLASMLEFARSRGWVDDGLGAIRAHVEHGAPPGAGTV